MKIQVKTLNQKSLLVEIDESKTVLDLKQELSRYPDVGVKPEQQKLIYAGKILEDGDILSTCNIDEKKFLVVMAVKQQVAAAAAAAAAVATSASSASASASASTTPKETEAKSSEVTTASRTDTQSKQTPAAPAARTTPAAPAVVQPAAVNTEQDEMVANIVAMGYPENEVRNALEASFNNPERAVEYLIEGIPMSPIGAQPQLGQGGNDGEDFEMSAFELLRTDPVFRNLRSLIQQNPDLIDEAVQRIGEANPALLGVINENQQEFLNMLFEPSDDEDGNDAA